MKPTLTATLVLACLAAAPTLGAAALQDIAKVRLRFAPAEGTVLAKTFDQTHGLVMRDSQIAGDDKAQIAMDQIELETRTLVSCTDEYLEVGPERPLAFRRKHDRVGFVANATRGAQEERIDTLTGHGAIGGHVVAFTWVPEEGDYGKRYVGPESEESFLPDLVAATSLEGLLPEREVSIGDEWTIPLMNMREVLAPGGEMTIRYERTTSILLARTLVMGVAGGLWEAFEGEPGGTVKARLESVRAEDGRRIAEVLLSIDLHCEVDQTELANELRNAIELSAGMSVAEAHLTLDLRGGGVLRWDVDRGLPVALELVCEEEVISEHVLGERTSDSPILHPVSESQRLHLSGAVRVEATFEVK